MDESVQFFIILALFGGGIVVGIYKIFRPYFADKPLVQIIKNNTAYIVCALTTSPTNDKTLCIVVDGFDKSGEGTSIANNWRVITYRGKQYLSLFSKKSGIHQVEFGRAPFNKDKYFYKGWGIFQTDSDFLKYICPQLKENQIEGFIINHLLQNQQIVSIYQFLDGESKKKNES